MFNARETMKWWVNWDLYLAGVKKKNNEIVVKKLQEARQSELDAAKGKSVEGWINVKKVAIDENTKAVVVTITIGEGGKDLPVTISNPKRPDFWRN